MGFLEEAIREHLELQRRHGGDPRQIALAEQEALEPVVPGHTPDWAQGPILFDHEGSAPSGPDVIGGQLLEPTDGSLVEASGGAFLASSGGAPVEPSGDPLVGPAGARFASSGGPPAEPPPAAPEPSLLEQETAELDMSLVLGIDAEAPPPADEPAAQPPVPEFGPVRARRIVVDPPPGGPEPDFEWEIPGVTPSQGANG